MGDYLSKTSGLFQKMKCPQSLNKYLYASLLENQGMLKGLWKNVKWKNTIQKSCYYFFKTYVSCV